MENNQKKGGGNEKLESKLQWVMAKELSFERMFGVVTHLCVYLFPLFILF